jgi:hypothetical protein
MIPGMPTVNHRKMTIRALGVVVTAAALTVACSAKTPGNAEPQSIPSTTQTAPSSAGTSAPKAAGGASTAEKALATWIGAVVSNNFTQACSIMADTEENPPKTFSAETCASDDPTVKPLHTVLDGLRTAFTPDNAPNPPKVEITGPAATGTEAKITADKVSIAGQNLDDIVLAHSTGVQPGQAKITFGLTKLKNGWYVTDFNLNI